MLLKENLKPISKQEIIILLTACIAPKAGIRSKLVRSDPSTRLGDYKNALSFYLKNKSPFISGVVFADNSGYPLKELSKWSNELNQHKLPVEFLSFDFPPPPDGLTYGFSEFALIRAALRESHLLGNASKFAKATGRYIFPDIDRLIRLLPLDYLIAVDSRTPSLLTPKRTPLTTVALALFDRRFYLRELATLHESMVPGPPWNRKQSIETVLFDHLLSLKTNPRILMRFPRNCEPAGIGANGDNYRSLKKTLQYAVRATARRLIPHIWI